MQEIKITANNNNEVRVDKNQTETPLLTHEETEKIVEFVLTNLKQIENEDQKKLYNHLEFYTSTHCIVFVLDEFPNLVIKLMRDDHAKDSKDNIDRSRQAFSKKQFRYCHIPQCETKKLTNSEYTLLITQKALGKVGLVAKEFIRDEIKLIDSNPERAKKWKVITRELAEATALMGYWDIQFRNLIWNDDNGWTFIDFEKVKPTLENQTEGLSRLIKICPPQFIDEIYDVAKEYGVSTRSREAAENIARQYFQCIIDSDSNSDSDSLSS